MRKPPSCHYGRQHTSSQIHQKCHFRGSPAPTQRPRPASPQVPGCLPWGVPALVQPLPPCAALGSRPNGATWLLRPGHRDVRFLSCCPCCQDTPAALRRASCQWPHLQMMGPRHPPTLLLPHRHGDHSLLFFKATQFGGNNRQLTQWPPRPGPTHLSDPISLAAPFQPPCPLQTWPHHVALVLTYPSAQNPLSPDPSWPTSGIFLVPILMSSSECILL